MNKLALFFIFVSSIELLGREVQQSTFSYWNKPDINIFYSLPTSINENTKILFIMHGVSRSAERYLNDWLPLAEQRNVVLIAPEFSKEFFPEYVYLMKTNSKGKKLKDVSLHLNPKRLMGL